MSLFEAFRAGFQNTRFRLANGEVLGPRPANALTDANVIEWRPLGDPQEELFQVQRALDREAISASYQLTPEGRIRIVFHDKPHKVSVDFPRATLELHIA